MDTVPHPEVRLLRKSAKQIMDAYAEAAWQSAGDFAQVEEAVRLAILELRGVLTSAGLRLSAEKSRRAQHCPGCGLLLRAWSLEPRRVVTAEGEATYSPIRYRCTRCGEDYYPLEEANGLSGSQYTTGAKAVIAETAAQRPYGHVSRSLGGERGLSVSPKEVDRTVREVGLWPGSCAFASSRCRSTGRCARAARVCRVAGDSSRPHIGRWRDGALDPQRAGGSGVVRVSRGRHSIGGRVAPRDHQRKRQSDRRRSERRDSGVRGT